MPEAVLDNLLAGLNGPQCEAVTFGEGPLLILAGAGSGKTRVLTHRIAYLLASGAAQPQEILAITFTNKAAGEMRERAAFLVGRRIRAMWVMTFHAACARMLRAHADRLGYTRQFSIYDQADSRRLIKRCIDELGFDPKRFTPAAMQSQISASKNLLRDADTYAEMVGSFFEQTVAEVYREYERQLHRMNAMDFDDLLVRAVNVLELFQEVQDRYATGFRYVLVDEYQDTNHAQYRWLQLLTKERRNLMVVGDDAQCLIEGTLVTMADGSERPIEEVRSGDEVRSGYGSGDFRAAKVLRVHRSERSAGMAITMRSGRRLVSTPEHVHFAGPVPEPKEHRYSSKCALEQVIRVQEPNPADAGRIWAIKHARSNLVEVDLCGGEGGRHRIALRDAEATSRELVAVRHLTRRGFAVRAHASLARDGSHLPFREAADVRPGMLMFDADGGYDVVEAVEPVALERPVYDLDIEHTHNFIANGLVTHNSIYGFRGADIRNILDFEDYYPDAHTVRLEQNYRSTQTILDAANAVIANNRGQKHKTLWSDLGRGDPIKVRDFPDEHAEGRFVAGEIERLVDEGASRAEIAVFYRTNAQSRVLEDALVRAEIPYQVVGGTKFYERAEIKDVVAYLNVLVNPQDTGAFTRIVNSPRRGIGSTSMGRVLSYANTTGVSIWDAASDPEQVPDLGAPASRALRRFMATMHALRERSEHGTTVAELIKELLRETGYREALEAERTIEAQGRIENLEELVNVAAEFDEVAAESGAGLAEFLQQIQLLSDADERSDDESLVTLMTLHNAKGLEYGIVFIIGCEEGVFPHARALDEGGLEEERRLCYVGITRAQRDLYLTWAQTRSVFGARTYGLASRFVGEIPADLTDREEEARQDLGRRPRATSWAAAAGSGPPPVAYQLGDDVAHPSFGEGVVTGLEPGGIVVVRFARDRAERKLVADLAPIIKR
jgi:superfamily I DNA/RNA helicase